MSTLNQAILNTATQLAKRTPSKRATPLSDKCITYLQGCDSMRIDEIAVILGISAATLNKYKNNKDKAKTNVKRAAVLECMATYAWDADNLHTYIYLLKGFSRK